MSLSFDELRALNVQRCPMFGHGVRSWNPLEWAGALCGEAGEAANVAKKLRRMAQGCDVNTDGDTEMLKAKLAEELADVVIYADLLAASIGYKLGEAVRFKFNVVSERVGFPEKL